MTSQTGERQQAPTLQGIDPSHRMRYNFVIPYVKEHHKVLDYGCGVGYGAYILSKAKFVMAADISEEAILYANKHYKRENITYSVQDTPMDHGDFDIITCFEVIEHVLDPVSILSSLSKSLSEDGLLFVSSPNEEKMPFSKERFPFHKRHYTPNELKGLLEASKLKIVSEHNQYSKAVPGIVRGFGGSFMIGVTRRCS